MFVYLDESGDCGFKFNQGSSAFFVVSLVITEDPDAIDRAVTAFRTSLNYRETHEFKFYRTDERRRLELLHEIARMPVRVRTLVIDKRVMTRPHMHDRDTFYGFVVKLLLRNSFGSIADATLILDESDKSKRNQQTLASQIRRECTGAGRTAEIRKVVHRNSRSHGALQVTDMVCGAVMADAKGEGKYLRVIRGIVEDRWNWRPNSPD
ncbi:MAG: DUF3800 domain-containing protein [Thermomicrobiales bacterium]